MTTPAPHHSCQQGSYDNDNDFIGMAANRLDWLQTKYTVNCKRKNKENREK